MAVGGWLMWNDAEVHRMLNDRNGPVGRDLARRGTRGAQTAKQLAPTSPAGSHGRPSGYLRSRIGWEFGNDSMGLYIDLKSPARTPDGKPYGLFMEVGTKAHDIESHGDYPLRNRRTGQIFGRKVHHPGTRPRPHLRPALDVMMQL